MPKSACSLSFGCEAPLRIPSCCAAVSFRKGCWCRLSASRSNAAIAPSKSLLFFADSIDSTESTKRLQCASVLPGTIRSPRAITDSSCSALRNLGRHPVDTLLLFPSSAVACACIWAAEIDRALLTAVAALRLRSIQSRRFTFNSFDSFTSGL